VMFFSIHRYPFYPGTGATSETGSGRGTGFTRNEPVQFGTPRERYRDRFQKALHESAQKIQPQIVFISAGFDGMRNDLLGRLDITPRGFAAITRVVVRLADELCQGRIVSVLEGGYRLDGLAESVTAHVRALQGE